MPDIIIKLNDIPHDKCPSCGSKPIYVSTQSYEQIHFECGCWMYKCNGKFHIPDTCPRDPKNKARAAELLVKAKNLQIIIAKAMKNDPDLFKVGGSNPLEITEHRIRQLENNVKGVSGGF